MNWQFPDYYRLAPEPFLSARHATAAAMLKERGLDGLLLTHAVDIYYLSGTMQLGVLFLDAWGQTRFFVRRHPGRAAAESPLPVTPVSGLTQVADELALPRGTRLGINLDVTSARDWLGWQKRLPGVEMTDVSGPWLEIMAVKDAFEIEVMTRAGQVATQVYAELPNLLRPGLTEAEAAGCLQRLAMAQGHIDLMRSRAPFLETYSWHLVSGPQGSLPSGVDSPYNGLGLSPAFPLGASFKALQVGEPIIVDFGLCLEGYQTDQTRTYVLGQAPEIILRAHACLEAVERVIAEQLRPGAISGEIFAAAVAEARAHGMGDVFLGRGDHRIRFCGHGVGLELGAPPYLLENSPARVKAGQCYALELKIVLDEGPVGLENTLLVNESGPPTFFTPNDRRLIEVG